jgi:hypothetical protein
VTTPEPTHEPLPGVEAFDMNDYCRCSGRGANDPDAVYCRNHERLDDALSALDRERAAHPAPCTCWVGDATLHSGHCCFRPLSGLDGWHEPWLDAVLFEALEAERMPFCHDEEEAAARRAAAAAGTPT